MTWQPIATAPTDRIILLYRPTAIHPAIRIAPGYFDDDKYAKKPKPYWEIWLTVWNGKTQSRNFMPTHWCDYPLPPTEPPTVMEILELSGEIEDAGLGQIDLVRAALERWGAK